MTDFLSALSATPVIGILRGVPGDKISSVINAAFDAGLTCVEITLNTPGAFDQIATVAKNHRPGTFIGAGTVLSAEACGHALEAGARFIVAPNTSVEVVSVCREKAIPVFPGALTPTEVYSAWQSGAAMVKVFPVSALGGPAYIKELRGPFDEVKLLACGGVNLENIHEFFNAGADAVAIGASVFKKEWIERNEFGNIGELVGRYVRTAGER
jgi:2-dehydro-3-deoxyphosphogluconate aldolase / (4S)-4-hydroxy-2-oxoglutarate aldolase